MDQVLLDLLELWRAILVLLIWTTQIDFVNSVEQAAKGLKKSPELFAEEFGNTIGRYGRRL